MADTLPHNNLIGGDTYNPIQDQPGGLLHDIRYNGNEQARYLASTYWDGALPQIDGDRLPEKAAKAKCVDIINNYILTNTDYTTKQSPAVTYQYKNDEYVSESTAAAQVTKVLLDTIGTVIVSGLDAMPAFHRAEVSRAIFPTKVTLVIFKAGILQQYDDPVNMYCEPVNCYCAKILGDLNKISTNDDIYYLRPENFKVVEKSKFEVIVKKCFFQGKEYKIMASHNGETCYFFSSRPLKVEQRVCLDYKREDLIYFDSMCRNFFE